MFENTPSDKVQFRALGEVPLPGTCLICGSGTREEGYVDLGFFIDYHGQASVCVTCVIQIGEVVGMLTSDEAKLQRGQMSDLLTENAALKATVDDLNDELSAYRRILGTVGVVPAVSAVSADNGSSEGVTESAQAGSDRASALTESVVSDGGHERAGTPEQDELTPAGIQGELFKL